MQIRLTGLISTFLFALLPHLARAETIDCGSGNVVCLVETLNKAAANAARKTTIRLSGTYDLTLVDNGTSDPNGLPSVVTDVTLDGGKDGAIFRRGINAAPFRLLHVGAGGRLTMNHVNVTNGSSGRGAGLRNDGGFVTLVNSSFRGNQGGAAVFSFGGVVEISDCVFENNGGFRAGAVWMEGGDLRIEQSSFLTNGAQFGVGGLRLTGGKASVSRTTFAGNVGDTAGALLIENSAALYVTDSALVENVAGGPGAIFNSAGTVDLINTTVTRNRGGTDSENGSTVLNLATLTLTNATFGENTGPLTERFSVIGSRGTTILQNTLLAHDPAFPGADCRGVIFSLGSNLVGDPAGCSMTLQASDRTGWEGLASLINGAAPGSTHYPLLPVSQAIDAADTSACPKKDQIGNQRPARCDIGAIEFRPGRGQR